MIPLSFFEIIENELYFYYLIYNTAKPFCC